jgi:uncharacterized protein YbjT (DUF2867 family)
VTARSFVLLGASGLVGGHLAKLLAAEPRYTRGTLLGRRATGALGSLGEGHVTEVIVDFDHLEGAERHLAVDDVYCCLGTTIKKAGSQAAFHKVDCDIPLAVARAARGAGAKQFLIVTAVGADAGSSVFYNRVKGEVEAGLAALNFPGGLQIVHPSLIVGERAERRPAERVAMALMTATRPLFAGGLARYRAIDAEAVARAMHHAAFAGDGAGAGAGVHVYEGRKLFALAG